MATNPQTPEALVGLVLDPKGFKESEESTKKQLGHWEQMEKTVGRISERFGQLTTRIMQLAGVGGIMGLANDFLRLEQNANRAALAIGSVTGSRAGFVGVQAAARAAGVATSQDSQALVLAMAHTQSAIGGNFFTGGNSAARQRNFMTLMGQYGNAYGMEPQQMGALTGSLLQMSGLGASQTRGLLAGVSNQAANAAGMAGSTGAFMQMVQGLMAQAVGTDVFNQGPGLAGRVGAFGSALARSSTLYRDPSRVNEAFGAINGALAGSYTNGPMAAWLQMAGVNYWDARSGLGGQAGLGTAQRILSFSQRQYGKGTMEQDIFLRSNFGEAGANAFRALQRGDIKSFKKFEKEMDPQASMADTLKRSAQTQDTTLSVLRNIREKLGETLDPIMRDVAKILDFLAGEGPLSKIGLGDNSMFEDLLTLWLGGKAAKGAYKVGSKLGGRAVGAGAAGAAGAAGGAGGVSVGGAMGKLLRGGLRLGGPAGAILAFGLDGGGAPGDDDMARANQGWAADIWEKTTRRYGEGWWNDKKVIERLRSDGFIDDVGPYNKKKEYPDWFLRKAIEGAREMEKGGGGGGDDPTRRFRKSVDKFAEAIEKATRGGGGVNQGASYAGPGGSANAAGIGGHGSNQLGQMMLASYAIGGAGGGAAGGGGNPNVTFASYGGGSGGGGGGGGGAWKEAVASWYDPRLGGTNGSVGGGAWPGHPISGTEAGFAHKSMDFGTRVEFRLKGGKKTTVAVCMDRGPFVAGREFDLLPGPAKAIGLAAQGVATVEWRVVGKDTSKGAGEKRRGGGKGGGSGGGSGGGGGSSPKDNPNVVTFAGGFGSQFPGASGGSTININVDGRRLERHRRLTRSF